MSDNNLVSSKIIVVPFIPMNGMYYVGQYGTSGYATAAKGYLYYYFSVGIPITWYPLKFDNSTLDNDDVFDVVISSLINKPLVNYDMVMLHCTPDLWPTMWKEKSNILMNKLVNGYCTWETNKLPPYWVKCINDSVNEVWCPSTYNEVAFKESGVTKQIRVLPHIFLPQTLPDVKFIKILNVNNGSVIEKDNKFTFYSIGEMNARKGIDDLINVYCKTFKESDPVRLILKVHYKNYDEGNKQQCRNMIGDILKNYPSHPSIICLFDNMTNKEILALHSIGDCYVSLTKSEGFGLTIFDAWNYKKKIICTGYSGHMDFLGEGYPGLIGYKLGPVKGMTSFSANYTEDQLWAYPDLDHASQLMKSICNL